MQCNGTLRIVRSPKLISGLHFWSDFGQRDSLALHNFAHLACRAYVVERTLHVWYDAIPKSSHKIQLTTMKTLIFCSFLLQGLAQVTDKSSYFGGSDVEGYYTAWLQGESYDKAAFIKSTLVKAGGVALHWTIDGETIKLAVAARATGWVALGLGESGSMLGADNVMFSAETKELVDSYPRLMRNTAAGEIAFMCGLALDHLYDAYDFGEVIDLSDISPSCLATHEATPDFAESRQLGRVFGATSDTCHSSVHGDPGSPTRSPSKPRSSAAKATFGYAGAAVIASNLFAL
jgi:hypothetical protein